VPQAGGEEYIGDDDGECGVAVKRERARRNGERQTRVNERAKVCGRELGARREGRRWKDERLFLGLTGGDGWGGTDCGRGRGCGGSG